MNREDIIKLAREAGLEIYLAPQWDLYEQLERFAALVASAEREACAKVCEELDAMTWSDFGEYSSGYADEIRARGEK